MNCFNGTTNLFEMFDAARILLAQPINFLPQKMIQRVTYVIILALFLLITNDLYSGIVEINFGKEEVPMENLEDLDKFEMPIFIHERFKDLFRFDLDEPLFKRLDTRIKLHSDCKRKFLYAKNYACIDWKYDVEAWIDKNRKSDGSPTMKKVDYLCDPLFVGFEPGSPYMKGFSKTNRRISEAGLMRMVYLQNGFIKKIENDVFEGEYQKNLSNQQLLVILTIGYSVAVIVFMIEYFMVSLMKLKINLLTICSSF